MITGILFRRTIISILIFSNLALPEALSQPVKTDTVSVSPFGQVFLYSPQKVTSGNLIIMISGDGGWKFGVPEFAREFARGGSFVAGVDILRYYRHLRELKSDCYRVFSDFVELATAVERKFGFQQYTPPVIMGYSSGATLVYGILAQARPGTFIGGISLGFCPDIELPKMLCQTNGLKEKVLKPDKSFLLLPDPSLGNPWIVLHGKIDKVCDFQTVEEFIKETGNARLIPLKNVGHGFSRWSDFMPQWKDAYAELINKYNDEDTLKPLQDISGLPVRVFRGKVNTGSKMITLMFSGDGGWYGFEESLSTHLGKYGIPVIGMDTKKYLWNRKTPEEAAKDVANLLRYYGGDWDKSEFMLFGYSQGAEILPFIYNRLPEDLKEKVKSLVMLSPEKTTDFEIHITNMMGLGSRENTYKVIPELEQATAVQQIFVLGEDERSDLPELLKNTGAQFVKVPGDHHYQGNASLIIEKLKEDKAF